MTIITSYQYRDMRLMHNDGLLFYKEAQTIASNKIPIGNHLTNPDSVVNVSDYPGGKTLKK